MPRTLDIPPATEAAIAHNTAYITYKCKSPVNLNFLFREVLVNNRTFNKTNGASDGSDQVSIIPCYQTAAIAETFSNNARELDTSTTHGKYIAMRFLNALMSAGLQKSSVNSIIQSNLFYFGGYSNGLVSGSTVNTTDATATVELGEFFQVSLAAIKSKGLTASSTRVRGLVNRELINNSVVSDDIMNRNFTDLTSSNLLRSALLSSKNPGSFPNGMIDGLYTCNWMKLMVHRIVDTTYKYNAANVRFAQILLTNPQAGAKPDYLQLKLKTGDIVHVPFVFRLSDTLNNDVNFDRQDNPGIPITVQFEITHSDTAPDYNPSQTGTGSTLPVGWQLK
jgi:hypothetical protein